MFGFWLCWRNALQQQIITVTVKQKLNTDIIITAYTNLKQGSSKK